MKHFFKKLVVVILARQVRALCRSHQFKIVGVAGSVGKTSTKLAIAQTLGKSLRVRYQHGNYNDIVSVPLVFFGHNMPSLLNPFAWIRIFINNARQIAGEFPFDIVVVELGTDGPGQMEQFKRYLSLNIAVVTAIVPEHMEYFTDLKAVADEEMTVTHFSDEVIYCVDMIAAEFRSGIPEGSISYGLEEANFQLSSIERTADGLEGDVKFNGGNYLHVEYDAVSETQMYSLLAAIAVSNELGLAPSQITDGLTAVAPVNGRLRRLKGMNDSVIIDDTYNASPEAVKAGLEALYKIGAPQKIAILGNMNELGKMSREAHELIGRLCDPKQLGLVVTIGPDANAYLAPVAKASGCEVETFDNPYAAGEFLQGKVKPGGVIFAKGSQNGVFAEEAVKLLLADPNDADKLVRQSDYWLKRKKSSFKEG